MVTMSTTRLLSDGSTFVDNNELSFVIDPALRPGPGCVPPVAVVSVSRSLDGTVTITVPK
jgi:hypothetical protein